MRERARRARAALDTARREDDPDAMNAAESEWDDVTRMAREHDIDLGIDRGHDRGHDRGIGGGLDGGAAA